MLRLTQWNTEKVENCGCSTVSLSVRLWSRQWGEQRAEGRRVVTMGSVQEWRRQGRVQVAATQLPINSCETLQGQLKELLFPLDEKSLQCTRVFEVRKGLSQCVDCAVQNNMCHWATYIHTYAHTHACNYKKTVYKLGGPCRLAARRSWVLLPIPSIPSVCLLEDSSFHITCVYVEYWTRFSFQSMCDVTNNALGPPLQIKKTS